jgi:hypothetical protein
LLIYSQDSAGVLNIFFDRDLSCSECRCLFWGGSSLTLQGYDLSFELGSFFWERGALRSRAADERFYERSLIFYSREICAQLTFEALQRIYETFFERRPDLSRIPERSQRDPTAGTTFWNNVVDLWQDSSTPQQGSADRYGALTRRPSGSQGRPY